MILMALPSLDIRYRRVRAAAMKECQEITKVSHIMFAALARSTTFSERKEVTCPGRPTEAICWERNDIHELAVVTLRFV
jgi:hypothetical protein